MRLTTLLTLIVLLLVITVSCSKDPQQAAHKELTLAAISGVEGDALKAAALDYERQTGVHIEITQFPYANLFEKELIDLKSRTGAYDLIMLDDPWFPRFASEQLLTDLTPLLQQRGQANPDSDFLATSIALCRHTPAVPLKLKKTPLRARPECSSTKCPSSRMASTSVRNE